jgi:hypothetical protein
MAKDNRAGRRSSRAENIERLLAAELGVDWSAYDKEVSSK